MHISFYKLFRYPCASFCTSSWLCRCFLYIFLILYVLYFFAFLQFSSHFCSSFGMSVVCLCFPHILECGVWPGLFFERGSDGSPLRSLEKGDVGMGVARTPLLPLKRNQMNHCCALHIFTPRIPHPASCILQFAQPPPPPPLQLTPSPPSPPTTITTIVATPATTHHRHHHRSQHVMMTRESRRRHRRAARAAGAPPSRAILRAVRA